MGAAVALVLSLLVALPLVTLGAATPASAARPDGEIQRAQIEFDSMDPALPERDGTITLTGTVTNTTDEPISNLQVLLWRDQSPITDPEGLSAAIESDATTPWGARMLDIGQFQTITNEQMPALAPGASARFQIGADVEAMELPSTGGVYLIGAHALGQVGGEATETLGRNRLLMPLPAEGETAIRTPQSDVVVLSAQPSRAGDGTFLNDNLTDELAEGGRLAQLLRAAQRPGTSWIIDPALLEAVRAMAEGYTVVDGEARGQQLAQSWLDGFERLNRANGFRATYGLPDTSAIAHSENPELWQNVQRADAAVEGLTGMPRVEISGGGRLDSAGLALLEEQEPMAVLASTPDSEHSLLEPIGSAPIVNFDPDLFTGGPGPAPNNTVLHKRQRLLGQSWVQSYAGVEETQVRVISTGTDAAAVLDTQPAWTEPVTLRELLTADRYEWAQSLTYSRADLDAEAIASHRGTVGELQDQYAAVQSLFGNEPQADADAGLAVVASSWWRGRGNALTAFTQPQQEQLSRLLSQESVSLAVSSSVTMIAQDGGSFPATIQNHLDRPIQVSLRFDSAQPQRLSVPSHENLTIPPLGTATLTVQPEAAANGPVPVTAQLTTPDGTPIGNATKIQVNATNFGAVGWIIVVASGIVLVAATALRIRQVRHERAEPETDEVSVPAALPAGPSGTVVDAETPGEARPDARQPETRQPDPSEPEVTDGRGD